MNLSLNNTDCIKTANDWRHFPGGMVFHEQLVHFEWRPLCGELLLFGE